MFISMKETGMVLRKLRGISNKSVEAVAKVINVDCDVLIDIEKGKTIPSAKEQLALCDLYNCAWSSLFL